MNPKSILAQLNINPRKRWSQNFLISESLAQSLIIKSDQTDEALEIGPGLGILTSELSKQYRKVICVEIDPILSQHLNNLNLSNVTVYNSDVLQFDWTNQFSHTYDVYSNMPYHITGPILEKLQVQLVNINQCILTMQDEVAKRMVAPIGSKDRSKLTVSLNRMAEIKLGKKLAPGAFYPQPKVHSRIVYLKPKLVQPWASFDTVLRACFSSKRKQLKNNLVKITPYPEQLLHEANIAPTLRAEDLSVEDYIKLTLAWEKLQC